MDALLTGLRAAGEPTRLRLLAICAHGELSVTELTQILRQSQPRVSRHLKLLVEAGLLERFREGALVYYRIAENTESAFLARTLVDLLPEDDNELNRDLARLDQIRQKRAELASVYFQENAASWDRIRSLHVAQDKLEQELLNIVGRQRVDNFLDIGTGTGRILELLADQIERGVGIDQSSEMLALARSQLEQANLKHVHVRKGDMYSMPVENESFDLTTLHLVLHYSFEPGLVIAEAARALKPGGRLIVVDFAPHHEDQLRTEHKHQRLGFPDQEIRSLMESAGLQPGETREMVGDPLTVNIWQAEKLPASRTLN
ncbi:MAG: metalloregulator ArsR/SmtB family transcription factor [Granulosicoccus sp.]|nr:metalloregulator ArsR/SmtB family transcription factor [Granulosicoccus sp.]